jgi:cysteine sulfinate desulfinase/cysteine desulfurase-like protein
MATAILAAAMGTRSGTLALVAVAAAAAAAVVAGILLLGDDGTSSRESYQAAVVNARDRVDFAYGRIAQSQSPEDLIVRLDEASVVVADTASDLDDKGAPEELEELNDRLVSSLRAFSDVLAGTSAQFEDPTFAGTIPGITTLSFPEWDKVNEVLADLDEHGIAVEQLARH